MSANIDEVVTVVEVVEEVDEEEDPPPRGNPCEALTNLARADGPLVQVSSRIFSGVVSVKNAVLGDALEGKSYDGVQVVGVTVQKRERDRPRGGVRKQWHFDLKTRALLPGCDMELAIGGGGIHRAISDFEWLRGALNQEYAGCVVPAITAEAYEGDARALERFIEQCISHVELSEAPELAAFCVAAEAEFDAARVQFEAAYSRRPPIVVRVGALVLDVVGDATPIYHPTNEEEEDLVEVRNAKRREHDVRELLTWARQQIQVIGKCERECASGAAALEAFDSACNSAKTAIASRFNETPTKQQAVVVEDGVVDVAIGGGQSIRISGPQRALRALRQMSGLAKALCEAIEGRESLRLQLVASRNAAHLNEVSRDARGAMLLQSQAHRTSADDISSRLAEEQSRDEVVKEEEESSEETTEDPEIVGASLGMIAKLKLQARSLGAKGLEKTVSLAQKLKTAVSSREEAEASAEYLKVTARRTATQLKSLGLRVASRVADGAAYVSSTDADVEKARELVARLEGLFAVADERLRRDSPELKTQWDRLQIDAFDAFAKGEASRAVTAARQAAEMAAAQLADSRATPTETPMEKAESSSSPEAAAAETPPPPPPPPVVDAD